MCACYFVICFPFQSKYWISRSIKFQVYYRNSAVSPDFASNNGIIYNYCSNFETFFVLWHTVMSPDIFHKPASAKQCNAFWPAGRREVSWRVKQQDTAPSLPAAWTAQAAQCLGRQIISFQRHRASADLSALATAIFAENPPSPNRIGRQRGYLRAGW